MAYIPWWQRMSPPTFAERFNLGGLAKKRLGFDKGSHWTDFINPGELLIRQPSEEDKIEFKEDLAKGIEFAKEKWKTLWPELIKDFTPVEGEVRAKKRFDENLAEIAQAKKEKKYIEMAGHAAEGPILAGATLPWWTGVGPAFKVASNVLRLGKIFTPSKFKVSRTGDNVRWAKEARKEFNAKVKDDLGHGISVSKMNKDGEHVYQLALTGEKTIWSKDLNSLMAKRNAWRKTKVQPMRDEGFIPPSEFVKLLEGKGISAATTTDRGLSQQISKIADTYKIEKIEAGAGTGGGFWYKKPSPEKLEEIYKLRLKPVEKVPIAKDLIKRFKLTSHTQLNKVMKAEGYSMFKVDELNKYFPEIKGIAYTDPNFVAHGIKYLSSGERTPKSILNKIKYDLKKNMSGLKTEGFIVGSKKSTGLGKDVELMHTTPKKKKTGELLHWDDLRFGSAKENAAYANGLENIRKTFSDILSNVAKKHSGKNLNAVIETSPLLRKDYGFPNKMTVKEYVSRINNGLVDLASKTGGSVRGDILNITGNKLKFVPNKVGIDYSKVPGWGIIKGDIKKFEKTFKKIKMDAKGNIILDANGMPVVKKGYKLSDKEASDILVIWENAPEQVRKSLTTEAFTGKLEFAQGGLAGVDQYILNRYA